MAEKKRTLGAPTYPSPGEEPAIPFIEPVAETTEVEPAPRQSRRERRREAPQAQRKRYQQQRQAEQRSVVRDAEINNDPIAMLKLQTQREQAKFMSSVRKSGIVSEGQSKPTQRRKLSDLQQAYASMMVLHCLSPLQQGVNGRNVMSVVGMGTMMTMLSPNFRSQVGSYVTQIGPMISQAIDKKMEARTVKQGEEARERLARLQDRKGLDRDDVRGLAGRRLRKRLDKIERMERGHRDAFTEQSAALAHVGIVQSTYDEMRAPGADRKAIKDRYASAMSALYDYIADDGLDQPAVERQVRIITGQLIERDPEAASCFSELAHGQFIKTEPQEFYLPGQSKPTKLWTGDYTDSFGGGTVKTGAFSLREPMDAYEHRVAASKAIYGEMVSSQTVDEFNSVVEQYLVASAVRQYPDAVEQTSDPVARTRMSRARSMFSSMADDGLDDNERKLAYLGAYMDAMSTMSETHPEIGAMWAERFGENWHEKMSQMVDDYSDLGEEMAERAESGVDPETPLHHPGPRFTGSADGTVVDHEHPEDAVVEAELVEEDQAEEPKVDETQVEDADLITVEENEAGDDEAERALQWNDDELRVELSRSGDFGPDTEKAMIADGVSLNRAAAEGMWNPEDPRRGASQSQWRHDLIERMSDHMAIDMLQAARNPEGEGPDGGSWGARHVYRSRSRALGKLDPSRLNFSPKALETPEPAQQYAAEIDVRRENHLLDVSKAAENGTPEPVSVEMQHTPWDGDYAANTRARELLLMAESMSKANIPAGEQDLLHATAYVRGLEKALAVDPTYRPVVEQMVTREGAHASNWREHEFKGALSRTRSFAGKPLKQDYAAVEQSLGLKKVKDLDEPLPASVRSQEKKAPTRSKESARLDLRKTSRRTQAQRQNMWANGADVNSGRFDTTVESTPVPEGYDPQPGA